MTLKNPLLRPGSLLIVALSMSIGWGIRGNYGHETGAMFPGALAAIAACLLSGREDWRRKVAYFGLFGMLGWALGGSISYMQVIGYTHSGHAASQWFGFGGLFLIGFLWAALGGAGTALPAVYSDKQLKSLFRPLVVVLAANIAWNLFRTPILELLQSSLGVEVPMDAAQRHESALYWLDSDWVSVSVMLASLLIYDLVQRRFERLGLLLAYAAAGGLISYLLFFLLDRTVGTDWIPRLLVQPQGLYEDRFFPEQLAVTNWPGILLHLGQREGLLYRGEVLGLWGGALVGVVVYFVRFGRFAQGSGLFVAMAVGWWAGFLLLVVVGSLFFAPYGGLRMTPPRGDNWAGVLGTLIGALIYFGRQRHRSLIVVALLCGTVGGIGFSGAAWLELALVSYGNRNLQAPAADWQTWQQTTWEPTSWTAGERMPLPDFATSLETPPEWAHWQQQNWHSFLEQTYGFVNGLGLALALSVLVTRSAQREAMAIDRRTLLLALLLLIPGLAYVNLVKNVSAWTAQQDGVAAIPEVMRVPWMDVRLSTLSWFRLMFAAGTLAYLATIVAHFRRPIAFLSGSWLARSQLLYLLLLWIFVLGNLMRALPGFQEGRLLTEGIILLHAILVSLLILVLPRSVEQLPTRESPAWGRALIGTAALSVICLLAVPTAETWSTRRIYGDAPSGKRGLDFRFGPNASWKRQPLLHEAEHR